jgi:hypothetical protein
LRSVAIVAARSLALLYFTLLTIAPLHDSSHQ